MLEREIEKELLHQKVAELELKLKGEVERNTNLEQYSRRETESRRCRPIIVKFVCREDKDRVWLERGKIKQSTAYMYLHAYIT